MRKGSHGLGRAVVSASDYGPVNANACLARIQGAGVSVIAIQLAMRAAGAVIDISGTGIAVIAVWWRRKAFFCNGKRFGCGGIVVGSIFLLGIDGFGIVNNPFIADYWRIDTTARTA